MPIPKEQRKYCVDPIKEGTEHRLLYRLLKSLAQNISRELSEQGRAHAMIGGTALKIGHGLQRPSTDLDFLVEQGEDFRPVVRRAFKKIPDWICLRLTFRHRGLRNLELKVQHTRTKRRMTTFVDFVPSSTFDIRESHPPGKRRED